MANKLARDRPMAALVLSEDERSYLERQVRRHQVARSLSERCRIVLACGETFKLSSGPLFVDKVRDIIGLDL